MPGPPARRTVMRMRWVGAMLLLSSLVLMSVHAAGAEGKDPFRPPPGASSGQTGGVAPGATSPAVSAGSGGSASTAGGNLPRTGSDLAIQALAAAVLLAVGGALRLTAGALSI